ncbi:unnamed protein product [Symbiodinium necroappetens]|uniref:SMODS and SLOG-associating 2TM effector domain-containing protein n=1 Tax=Symbiodinium necroappetens TaxID=1628268 RepID=A0A813B0K2_9DINO|nr:unnamed protein product [Symbiodinium necroappetens]
MSTEDARNLARAGTGAIPPSVELLKFGRCLHPGVGRLLGYEAQEYVWLDSPPYDREQMWSMFQMWDLQPPSLVINLFGGYCHPQHLLLPADIETMEQLPGVDKVVKDARRVMQLQAQELDKSEEAIDMAELQRTIGTSLFDRLVEDMVALTEACSKTNSWLLFDQSNIGQLYYILEAALARTKFRPVILMFVDSALKEGCKFRDGKHDYQEEAWRKLEENVDVVHQEETLQKLPIVDLPPDLFPESTNLWPVPEDMAATEAAKRDTLWRSHYGRWFFRAATHYIFCKGSGNFGDSAVCFDLDWLGPQGSVYSSGAIRSGSMSDMIFSSLDAGRPAILFKHTGLASDLWSHVLENSWVNTKLFASITTLLRKDWHRLSQSFVVVDAFQDKPDKVLDKISACFAGTCGGATRLGEDDLRARSLAEASDLHRQLRFNANRFASRSNLMAVGGVTLSLLATMIAAWSAWLDTQMGTDQESFLQWVGDMALILMPALSGLAFTLLSRLRYMSKWGAVYLAAAQVESEIMRFRVQVEDYGSMQLPEEQEHTVLLASKVASHQNFITTRFTLEEESRGSAERSPLLEEDDEHLSSAAVFPSSGKTTISVEEYFEERVKTKLQYWQALAPRLSHRVALYEALIVLSSVLGTVLGALDQKLWIPFMVALGAAMNTLMHHEGLQARLSALNASIQDLLHIRHRWSALGVVERRTNFHKEWMVNLAEAES